ncbi:MAG TPA: hypothetical protein VEK57_24305 [Thermoanaerobaculia bacterium]|nr:hypothetical protein [Thermoanaerobaculia bacterium]
MTSDEIRSEEITQRQIRPGDQLQLTYPDGVVMLLENWIVTYPFVEGEIDEVDGNVPSEEVAGTKLRRFNIEDALKVEIMRLNLGRTTAMASGITIGGLALLVGLVFLAYSCPHVYVTSAYGTSASATQLIGEAYPGAMFKGMQRTDYLLLPPSMPGSPTLISIRNDHRERQWVDYARVGIVRHGADERAVASVDGVVLVSQTVPPAVVTANGHDVLTALGRTDGNAWQSVPGNASAAERSATSNDDRLNVSFNVTDPGDYVFIVTAENTHWYEAALGQAIGEGGSHYAALVSSRTTASQTVLQQWRDAAGIDLQVESNGNIDAVTPFGTAGFRTSAVADVIVETAGTVTFRMRSAAHYWRFDSVRLMRVVDRTPAMTFIEPACLSCGDRAAALRHVDGHYYELRKVGERLDLEATLPNNGTAFLVTSGYYNIEPISQTASSGMPPLREIAGKMETSLRNGR